MPDGDAEKQIDALRDHCLQFCATQTNEGQRLSMAKSYLGQFIYWLRVNSEQAQLRDAAVKR
jgi:hypothetical protein